MQPSDVEVAEGEVAVLNCGPPTGRPDPNVLWKKDGVPINVTDPHFTVSGSKVNIMLKSSRSWLESMFPSAPGAEWEADCGSSREEELWFLCLCGR